MFSSSLVSSAASGDETRWIVSTAEPYRAAARVGRRLVDAADDLRDGLRRPVGAAGVDPLRREGEVEVRPGREARLALEDRQQLAPGRPRVGRRLEHDELAAAQAPADLRGCVTHDREVRLALLGEGGRERDQDRIDVAQDVVVGRRAEPPLRDQLGKPLRGDVLDVAVAPEEPLDAPGVDVDEHDPATRLGEHLRERHADVASADDRDLVGPGLVRRLGRRRLRRAHNARMLPARPAL